MPRPRKSVGTGASTGTGTGRARSSSVTSNASGVSTTRSSARNARQSAAAASAAAAGGAGNVVTPGRGRTGGGAKTKAVPAAKEEEDEDVQIIETPSFSHHGEVEEGEIEEEGEQGQGAAAAAGGAAAGAAGGDERGPSDPSLPVERNTALPHTDVPVKLQIIQRESTYSPAGEEPGTKDIIIGRVKLPTVNGATHGFLLKRFDTNALAVSAMFKLAFPYATPDDEAREMSYLENKYNSKAANGGLVTVSVLAPNVNEDGTPAKRKPGRPRKEQRNVLPEGSTGVVLQGTWVAAEDAVKIAREYGLLRFAQPLIDARAAQFDGKPYFVNDEGRPIAQPNGALLERAQSDLLIKGKVLVPPQQHRPAGALHSLHGTPLSSAAAAAAGGRGDSAKRARVETKVETDEGGHKRVSTTATSVVNNSDGSTSLHTTKHTASVAGKTQAEIEQEIAASKAIAKQAQQEAIAAQAAAAGGSSSASGGGKKRRAVGAPSADVDAMADDDDYYVSQGTNVLSRTFRRGTRVVQRRPVASSASALAAAGALGAATAAYLNPQTVDVALQALQAGVASVQGWFF